MRRVGLALSDPTGLLASGLRDFKLVVLKTGKLPAITTARLGYRAPRWMAMTLTTSTGPGMRGSPCTVPFT